MGLEADIALVVQDAVVQALRPILRQELEEHRQLLQRPQPGPSSGDEGELLTVAGAASLMHVRPETIRRWIRAGKLPTHGTRRAMRIARADLLLLRPETSEAGPDLQSRLKAIVERRAAGARGERR